MFILKLILHLGGFVCGLIFNFIIHFFLMLLIFFSFVRCCFF